MTANTPSSGSGSVTAPHVRQPSVPCWWWTVFGAPHAGHGQGLVSGFTFVFISVLVFGFGSVLVCAGVGARNDKARRVAGLLGGEREMNECSYNVFLLVRCDLSTQSPQCNECMGRAGGGVPSSSGWRVHGGWLHAGAGRSGRRVINGLRLPCQGVAARGCCQRMDGPSLYVRQNECQLHNRFHGMTRENSPRFIPGHG